jgi:hypothetical protein
MSIFSLIPDARTNDRTLDRQIGSDALKAQPDPPCELGCPHAARCAGREQACEAFYAYTEEPNGRPMYRAWRSMPRLPATEWYAAVYGKSTAALRLRQEPGGEALIAAETARRASAECAA